MSDTGPGKTRFVPNADGSISLKRWNDSGWVTRFADPHQLNSADSITRLLAEAYRMGMDDKATIIKQAIGF